MGTATGVEAGTVCPAHAPRLVSVNDEFGSVREFACQQCGQSWFE